MREEEIGDDKTSSIPRFSSSYVKTNIVCKLSKAR